jgi:Pretoxin HINT domain
MHNYTPPPKSSTPCFAAGTLVRTKEGLKNIEKIEIGEWVLSYPGDQTRPGRPRQEHEHTYREVKKLFAYEDELISHITVFDLAAGIKEIIKVSGSHPIYEKDSGWQPASQAKFGNAFENAAFGNLLVTRVKHEVERAWVYNIEVDEFQTYYAGSLGVWVRC